MPRDTVLHSWGSRSDRIHCTVAGVPEACRVLLEAPWGRFEGCWEVFLGRLCRGCDEEFFEEVMHEKTGTRCGYFAR